MKKGLDNIEPGKVVNIKKHGNLIKCGSGLIKIKHMSPKLQLNEGVYL